MFDEINLQEQPLGFCKRNIQNYEGFAVWLEALLCEATGNEKIWQIKREEHLYSDYVELFEYEQNSRLKKLCLSYFDMSGCHQCFHWWVSESAFQFFIDVVAS